MATSLLRCTFLIYFSVDDLVVFFILCSYQWGWFAGKQLKRLRDGAKGAGPNKGVEGCTDGNIRNKYKKKKQEGWFGWWANLTGDDKAKQDGDVSIDDLWASITEKNEPKEVCGTSNGHVQQKLWRLLFWSLCVVVGVISNQPSLRESQIGLIR